MHANLFLYPPLISFNHGSCDTSDGISPISVFWRKHVYD